MSEFIPLSSQLGVSGTSYRLQLGKIGDKWATRILKGKDVVASTALDELNGNLVVGFVMRETAIPNLNPYSIMKTVQFLTREAKSNEEKMKKTGIPAPTGGAVPADSPSPAPTPAASTASADVGASEEDTRASYRVIAKPREESSPAATSLFAGQVAARTEPKQVSSTGRKLKPIPGASATPAGGSSTAATSRTTESTPGRVQDGGAGASTGDISKVIGLLEKILEKLENIEKKL